MTSGRTNITSSPYDATMLHSEQPSPNKSVKDPRECASPSSYLGLTLQAVSPRSTPKSVSIAPHAEIISPLILGRQKSVEELQNGSSSSKRTPVKSPKARRLSGRRSKVSSPYLKPLPSALDDTGSSSVKDQEVDDCQTDAHDTDHFDHFVEQISSWIKEKRAKRSRRKAGHAARLDRKAEHDTPQPLVGADAETDAPKQRRGSDASDDSVDLDKLERILKQNLSLRRPSLRRGSLIKSKSSMRRLLRKQSSASDSDYFDNEMLVPSCDVVLDNSKTLAYSGGASDMSGESGTDDLERVASRRDHEAWAKFKFEIVRLSHTLLVKGWRKVPLEMSAAIEVQRLSGALTNAVYVVSPPSDLPLEKTDESGNVVGYRKPPQKLLLRIYGPQVEHLIDRDAELAILRRLARKKIGPRLLGTFANGRFEEYFHAKPLTPEELRDPDTSRQIAKRMRELHDGIELLDQERCDGAFVWRNWDKWLDRVGQVTTWMDDQVRAMKPGVKPIGSKAWLRRGYICGVPWEDFKAVVQKYREWLQSQYGDAKHLQEQLVFAHNDTQYGNILRLVPTGESPLLLPANTHKQLIVIDFEYASANMAGLEFANHFTEWCYNYHDPKKPYAFHASRYPTPEEQDRFIRAYVRHRPQFNVSTPKMTPMTTPPADSEVPGTPMRRPTTSISDFMLDARNPGQATPTQISKDEAARKAAEDAEVKRLMDETRLWRLANTAQWVAWGLVQAKVPGMQVFESKPKATEDSNETAEELLGDRAEVYKELVQEQQSELVEEDEEFDYLGYAQHRALFFWADALRLGFVKPEELPEETRAKVKNVPF